MINKIDRPGCFGKFWDGATGGECSGADSGIPCGGLQDCLHVFACGDGNGVSGIQAASDRLVGDGVEVTPKTLADACQTCPESILIAMDYALQQSKKEKEDAEKKAAEEVVPIFPEKPLSKAEQHRHWQ